MMELLKKWLDGSIKWKEEKELRTQARDDNFLKDALAGLDALPNVDHVQHIKVLEQRLQERISKKDKQVAYPWRAIAAAAILLLSAGIWWNMQSDLNPPAIAENQLQPEPPHSSALLKSPPSEYTTGAISPNTGTAISEKIVKENVVMENIAKEKKKQAILKKPPPTKEALVERKIEQKKSPSPAPSNELQEAISYNMSQETVESIANTPNIIIEETTPETYVIETPNPQLETTDGVIAIEEAMVSSPAPVAMVATAPKPEIAMSRSLSDTSERASRSAKRNLPNTSKVFPIGGMEAFRSYIKENSQLPETGDSINSKGSVFLVFKLNQDGTVKHAIVTKSVHPTYDEEAIRLLMEGPKWHSPAKIGYCKISFGIEE